MNKLCQWLRIWDLGFDVSGRALQNLAVEFMIYVFGLFLGFGVVVCCMFLVPTAGFFRWCVRFVRLYFGIRNPGP